MYSLSLFWWEVISPAVALRLMRSTESKNGSRVFAVSMFMRSIAVTSSALILSACSSLMEDKSERRERICASFMDSTSSRIPYDPSTESAISGLSALLEDEDAPATYPTPPTSRTDRAAAPTHSPTFFMSRLSIFSHSVSFSSSSVLSSSRSSRESLCLGLVFLSPFLMLLLLMFLFPCCVLSRTTPVIDRSSSAFASAFSCARFLFFSATTSSM